MKKKYLSPAISELMSETEEIMVAASVEGFNRNLDDTNTINTDDMLSRHSLWDDED